MAAVPVSVRTESHQGTLGNQVSMMLAGLPTNLDSPADRLAAVHLAMGVAKEQHDAIPASLLADVSEFALPVLANQAWRLSARLRLFERVSPYNVIISNVPGPNVPLYLAGAKLLAYYPVSAISDGQGLNITVMSYCGTMYFGLVACRELMPDLDVSRDICGPSWTRCSPPSRRLSRSPSRRPNARGSDPRQARPRPSRRR